MSGCLVPAGPVLAFPVYNRPHPGRFSVASLLPTISACSPPLLRLQFLSFSFPSPLPLQVLGGCSHHGLHASLFSSLLSFSSQLQCHFLSEVLFVSLGDWQLGLTLGSSLSSVSHSFCDARCGKRWDMMDELMDTETWLLPQPSLFATQWILCKIPKITVFHSQKYGRD